MYDIFIHKWRDLQFKLSSELQIFVILLMTILFTLGVLARNLLRKISEEIFVYISFCWRYLARVLNRRLMPNKLGNYFLNFGDFKLPSTLTNPSKFFKISLLTERSDSGNNKNSLELWSRLAF